MLQSENVSYTINGSGEVYSCTLNNQTMDITSGQTVQLTGLAPNTNYTVNCRSVNGSCLEARATFTTGTVIILYYNTYIVCYMVPDTSYLRDSEISRCLFTKVSMKVSKDRCSTTSPLSRTTCADSADRFMHLCITQTLESNIGISDCIDSR